MNMASWRAFGAALILISQPAMAAVGESAATAEIRAALARDGTASVIVGIAVNETADSVRVRERAQAEPTGANQAAALAARRERISAAREAVSAQLAPAGLAPVQSFDHLPFVVMRLAPADLARVMSAPDVNGVFLNRPMRALDSLSDLPYPVVQAIALPSGEIVPDNVPEKALLTGSVGTVGADRAWARGFTGRDTAVAVLDDGVDRTHDMFIGKVVAEACFSDRVKDSDQSLCPNGAASSTAPGSGTSGCGGNLSVCAHGSHVAGIAVGNDTLGTTTLRGIAYESNLVSIQVFSVLNTTGDCGGESSCLRAYTSSVLQALNHVITIASTHKIAAVNLSLGGDALAATCDNDIRKPAVDTLRSLGVITVAAAGNNGQVGQIDAPSCISSVFAVSGVVGSTPDSGVNQASTVDLLAPSVAIRSAGLSNVYIPRSGTSNAAPHVAGAIAILKSAKPSAPPSEIETALKAGGIPAMLPSWSWTTSRLDINGALDRIGAGGISGTLVPGVFSSRNQSALSFLRFINVDQSAGQVTVSIYDDVTGQRVGVWTKTIGGLASPQFSMQTIEQEATPPVTAALSTSPFYSLFVDAPFNGHVQHVLWNPVRQTLSNFSYCSGGIADTNRYVGNVHTSLIRDYKSFLLIHNTSAAEATPRMTVRDSRNGAEIGSLSLANPIKPHTSVLVPAVNLVETLGRTPDSTQFHVNVLLQDPFEGFIQHIVNNEAVDFVTSMSERCGI